MLPSKAFLSFIFLALTVVGAEPRGRSTGKGTLELAMRINRVGPGMLNIAERDRARAHAFKNSGNHSRKRGDVDVTNAAVVYTAQVGIGEPATNHTLLIDTGSSNTWISAGKGYLGTGAGNFTGGVVHVAYGDGSSIVGMECIDTVTLSPGLIIRGQSIGIAEIGMEFDDVDGILGVGPVDLTRGTVSDTDLVPTVMDNLLPQGIISQEVLGIYFVPASEKNSGGTLTFGGVDDTIAGSVNYVPLTTASPASDYWGIEQSIAYGGKIILSHTTGNVDTGHLDSHRHRCALAKLTDAFHTYQAATGATPDGNTGLLTITPDQYDNLQTLTFTIGEQSYDLSPNAQIWPRSLNTVIGGNSNGIYLVINDIDSNFESEFDFINGYTFLERYYSVYDTTNDRIGFAKTAYTDSTSN